MSVSVPFLNFALAGVSAACGALAWMLKVRRRRRRAAARQADLLDALVELTLVDYDERRIGYYLSQGGDALVEADKIAEWRGAHRHRRALALERLWAARGFEPRRKSLRDTQRLYYQDMFAAEDLTSDERDKLP